jgi:hypothetical protein
VVAAVHRAASSSSVRRAKEELPEKEDAERADSPGTMRAFNELSQPSDSMIWYCGMT